MSLIPEEELKRHGNLNLAPMVDFLFLVVAVFATLAVTRAALYDNEVKLVKMTPSQENPFRTADQGQFFIVNLSVNKQGQYKWISEMKEYLMEDVQAIRHELIKQQELGLLPKEKEKTKVLLHIDRNAEWEPIAQVIYAVREAGFSIHPVHEPLE